MRTLRVHLFIAAMFAALAVFSFTHIGCSDGGEDDTMSCDAQDCADDECFVYDSEGACVGCTDCPLE